MVFAVTYAHTRNELSPHSPTVVEVGLTLAGCSVLPPLLKSSPTPRIFIIDLNAESLEKTVSPCSKMMQHIEKSLSAPKLEFAHLVEPPHLYKRA